MSKVQDKIRKEEKDRKKDVVVGLPKNHLQASLSLAPWCVDFIEICRLDGSANLMMLAAPRLVLNIT